MDESPLDRATTNTRQRPMLGMACRPNQAMSVKHANGGLRRAWRQCEHRGELAFTCDAKGQRSHHSIRCSGANEPRHLAPVRSQNGGRCWRQAPLPLLATTATFDRECPPTIGRRSRTSRVFDDLRSGRDNPASTQPIGDRARRKQRCGSSCSTLHFLPSAM